MRSLFIVAAALPLLACTQQSPRTEPGVGALPTFAQFRAAHPGNAFQAAPERRTTVLAGVNSVTNGMSRYQVAALLGRPDWSSALVPKENDRPFGSVWDYTLASANLDLVNERTDQRVHIYFSPAGLVTGVAAVNLPAPSTAGRPAGT